jgi:hypothetical protein
MLAHDCERRIAAKRAVVGLREEWKTRNDYSGYATLILIPSAIAGRQLEESRFASLSCLLL